jgi:hypothetical protein
MLLNYFTLCYKQIDSRHDLTKQNSAGAFVSRGLYFYHVTKAKIVDAKQVIPLL